MTTQTEVIARKVGLINAAFFFIVWSCIGALSAAQPIGSLPVIIFLLVPASALVGWRGAASVRHILGGTASLRRALSEGFVSGACLIFLVWLWGTANSAFAAGSAIDGLSPLQVEFWFVIAVTLLPALGLGGVLGAMHGVVFFYLNRWLVQANLSFKRDA